MGIGPYLKRYLPVLGTFLVIATQNASADLSGKAETIPERGLIRVKGQVLSLQGIQVISHDAICKDNKGHWPCGEIAWQAFGKKLALDSVHCILIINLSQGEGSAERANCLLKTESLNAWLVRQGWALTHRDPEAFLSNQESFAKKNRKGVWRDGFIPPDIWRPSVINDSKNCNVCRVRHQSFLGKTRYRKSL